MIDAYQSATVTPDGIIFFFNSARQSHYVKYQMLLPFLLDFLCCRNTFGTDSGYKCDKKLLHVELIEIILFFKKFHCCN